MADERDEPTLRPIPDPSSYKLAELIEEMQTTYQERNAFINGRLQVKKIDVQMANLQRYRLGRLVAIERLLKAVPGIAHVTMVDFEKHGVTDVSIDFNKLSADVAAADPRLEEQDEDVDYTIEDTIGDHTGDVHNANGPGEGDSRAIDSLPSGALPKSPNVDYDEVERLYLEKMKADDAEQAATPAEPEPPAEEVEW